MLSAETKGLRQITPSEICISSYRTEAKFNNCLTTHSKYFQVLKFNKTVQLKLIKWMILKLLYIIKLKSAKISLSVCVAVVNSFAMSMVESLSVLSLCMFKTVRLLNRCWLILERSHVFSLRAAVKYLSPAALVAGFTKISLHNGITSFISCRPGL